MDKSKIIDKDELKTIRDDINTVRDKIDSFLKQQNSPMPTQQPIYESYDLNGREQVVIDYLNGNPGATKEQVVDGVCKNYSRMTVLKTIAELEDKGFIIARQDKVKKRTYNLYVNYQNIAISLKQDLQMFRFFYCELLDHARQVITELLKEGSADSVEKMKNLEKALVSPYKYLCIMYITSDLFLWNKRPLDNDTLHRKFEILFQTVKKIHGELIKIFPQPGSDLIASQFLYDSSYGFYESHIVSMLETFEEYGLSRDAERVIDLLWKISYPVLPLIYPSIYDKYANDGILEDWRKMLELFPSTIYKVKTQMLPDK